MNSVGNVHELKSSSIFDNFIWLNTKEAAEYLRTSPKQIRKWVYQGRIKAYKLLGKSLRFKKSDLDLPFSRRLIMGVIAYEKEVSPGAWKQFYMVVAEAINRYTGERVQKKRRGIPSKPKAQLIYKELWSVCREERPDIANCTH